MRLGLLCYCYHLSFLLASERKCHCACGYKSPGQDSTSPAETSLPPSPTLQMGDFSDVSIEELAQLTECCTGADITLICREAALAAMEEDVDALEVSMRHFKTAIGLAQPSDVQFYEELSSLFERLVVSGTGKVS